MLKRNRQTSFGAGSSMAIFSMSQIFSSVLQQRSNKVHKSTRLQKLDLTSFYALKIFFFSFGYFINQVLAEINVNQNLTNSLHLGGQLAPDCYPLSMKRKNWCNQILLLITCLFFPITHHKFILVGFRVFGSFSIYLPWLQNDAKNPKSRKN